jgi:hypothetical protein
LRLLKLLDDNTITTTASFNSLFKRATVDGQDVVWKARLRIIILTAIVVSLGVVVPLYRILKEFNLLVAYHKRFAEVRCQGLEMGWLSARKAPGFKGWGERRLKDFIMKAGLSGSLDGNANANNRNGANGYANGHSRNNHNGTMPNRVSTRRSRMLEDGKVEVDVHSLFTIGYVISHCILLRHENLISFPFLGTNSEIPITLQCSLMNVTKSSKILKWQKPSISSLSGSRPQILP